MLQLLIENKSPLNASDISGLTPLHHGEFRLETQLIAIFKCSPSLAISEGHGDTALLLLKEGAETDRQDADGKLAIDLAPDNKVLSSTPCLNGKC